MALFRSNPGEEIERYAHELADELARQFPPELERNSSRSVYDRALMRALEDTCDKAAAYRRRHRLRFVQKTRFANAFRSRLEALAYSSRFIDTATEALVVYLGRRT